MPLITGSKTQPKYDVVVVGSGAAGGMCAYLLAQSGVKVLMLEAGRNYKPAEETAMLNLPSQAPLRGASTPDRPFGFYDATVGGGWKVPGEPYTQAPSLPEKSHFMWWRPRMLGGRTNHWGRISLRMGEYDFKPKQRDGLGLDWPLNYADLAPYYDKVEALIGVYGSNEGLENTPNSSPGILLPPPLPRAFELLTKKACGPLGIPVIPSHLAILSKVLDHNRIAPLVHPNNPKAQALLKEHIQNRLACIWATHCVRGCSIGANFQSTTVLLPPAIATGNLDIITEAMVREVTVDKHGHATGVHYIDKVTRADRHAAGRVVILAAGGCESARILLNSKNSMFPQGVGNSSGKVGKYLMDTVGARVVGQIPALENTPNHNEDGASAMHMYMPWWQYKQQKAGRLNFARGYHIEFFGGRKMLDPGGFKDVGALSDGVYGKKLRQEARRYYGTFVSFGGRGEMIPNEDSYCELDPEVVDQWGIPVLRFNWKWSDHEVRQAAHMHKTFGEIIDSMGGKPVTPIEKDGRKALWAPGELIHEVGTTVMGTDKTSSVVNQWGQTWDVKNLFVADGGPFASNADKNPTLTIMALAWRASEHVMAQLAQRSI